MDSPQNVCRAIDWDAKFMDEALTVAQESQDPSTKVGPILVMS